MSHSKLMDHLLAMALAAAVGASVASAQGPTFPRRGHVEVKGARDSSETRAAISNVIDSVPTALISTAGRAAWATRLVPDVDCAGAASAKDGRAQSRDTVSYLTRTSQLTVDRAGTFATETGTLLRRVSDASHSSARAPHYLRAWALHDGVWHVAAACIDWSGP